LNVARTLEIGKLPFIFSQSLLKTTYRP
jgi:hypothetical protein